MNRTLLIIALTMSSLALCSETLTELTQQDDLYQAVDYQTQSTHTLQKLTIRAILSSLLQNTPESVNLLKNPQIRALQETIKEEVIKNHLVLLLAIFKEVLHKKKLPLESVIAGGFCGEKDHLVFLNGEERRQITLWSLSDLNKPLGRKPLIVSNQFNTQSHSVLKTGHLSNRFVIQDRFKNRLQIWYIHEEEKPRLTQEESLVHEGNQEISLSTDGTQISTSGSYPVVETLKDHSFRVKRALTPEEDNDHTTYAAPALISGNKEHLVTQSTDGNLVYWDSTSDKPTPLKTLSDEGYRGEALDNQGRFLIVRKEAQRSFHFWDCQKDRRDTLYEKETAPTPFTPHEPAQISKDGTLATLSLAAQDPVICDLSNNKHTTLPLEEESTTSTEISFIQLNTTNELLLYIKSKHAYLISLISPMNERTLDELLLLIKLALYGTELLATDPYKTLYNQLPDDTKNLVTNHFNLPK